MILNRSFYTKISFLGSWWHQRQMRKLEGEKVFKAFKLHKTTWPNKLYSYSPRLKRYPKFIATENALSSWKEAKMLEALCPTNAIQVTTSKINIDYRGCIGCGLCVEASPEGFLEISSELMPPNLAQ